MYKKLARFSYKNKDLLRHSENAGCYHCVKMFKVNNIKEWADKGETALCPKCGIDAVLPLDEILERMHSRYFSRPRK